MDVWEHQRLLAPDVEPLFAEDFDPNQNQSTIGPGPWLQNDKQNQSRSFWARGIDADSSKRGFLLVASKQSVPSPFAPTILAAQSPLQQSFQKPPGSGMQLGSAFQRTYVLSASAEKFQ